MKNLLAAVLLCASLTSAAADEARDRAVAACKEDALSLCSGWPIVAAMAGNEEPVKRCMRAHRADLGPACRAIIDRRTR